MLAKYARFGVHLGLERIQRLLAALDNPHLRVPIVHVAGTNGKGSVCAYLSSVLTQAGYRVGRYTSPHLVSWCERVCINDRTISPEALERVLVQVEAAISPTAESPTQFEVLTAAAWLYFAQQAVDIAVIEVGLGGRLDATNVVDSPLVAVITSISREHWQRLGPTLADIAREKAGVLKRHRPAVIGPLPEAAETVILGRAKDLQCPVSRPTPAQVDPDGIALYDPQNPAFPTIQYPIPLPGSHQLINSAIAIKALYQLRQQGWFISDQHIYDGMAQAQWPGRLQWVNWCSPGGDAHLWLIDGAHNPAAARVLRKYVDDICTPTPSPLSRSILAQRNIPYPLPSSVTWLMGMLSTKDHADVFHELLRPGDRLHLVPVPDHASMPTDALRAIAREVCPELSLCDTHDSLSAGLEAAVIPSSSLKILCGSLYLVGHFLGTQTLSAV